MKKVPDQSCIAETNDEKYEYLIATRGNDYILVSFNPLSLYSVGVIPIFCLKHLLK